MAARSASEALRHLPQFPLFPAMQRAQISSPRIAATTRRCLRCRVRARRSCGGARGERETTIVAAEAERVRQRDAYTAFAVLDLDLRPASGIERVRVQRSGGQ